MLSVFAWIFFRAENISHALNYTINIFSVELFSKPQILEVTTGLLITPLTIPLLIVIFVLVEWCGRENNFAIEKIVLKWNGFIRYSFYSAILLAILWYAQGKEQTFIYFQF